MECEEVYRMVAASIDAEDGVIFKEELVQVRCMPLIHDVKHALLVPEVRYQLTHSLTYSYPQSAKA